MDNIPRTKYTSQYIDNMSFDDQLKVKMVEIIGADGDLKNPATEETLLDIKEALEGETGVKAGKATDAYGYQAISETVNYKYVFYEDGSGNWYIERIDNNIVTSYTKGTGGYETVYVDSTSAPSGSLTWGTYDETFDPVGAAQLISPDHFSFDGSGNLQTVDKNSDSILTKLGEIESNQLPNDHDVTVSNQITGYSTESKQDNIITKLGDIETNQTDGSQKSKIVDDSGNNIGGKFYDETTDTYKGFIFNAEAPQVCSQDYLLAMSEGDITGHVPFSKYGRVAGVNNTLVDVWAGEGGTPSIYVFPSSAVQMTVVSTSTSDDNGSTGANKIMIYGLDSNYAEISEEVTMDGTTPVTTSSSFLRVNYCMVSLAGSAGTAVGDITIKNGAVTYGRISAGLVTCRQLIYTVPAGKTLYLTSINVASGAGGNAIKLNATVFTPKYREYGSTVFLPAGELLTINGNQLRNLEVPAKFSEKTDIKMSVVGDYNAGGTLCIGAVRGWLE